MGLVLVTEESGEDVPRPGIEASAMFVETLWATPLEAACAAVMSSCVSEADMGEFEQPPAELI